MAKKIKSLHENVYIHKISENFNSKYFFLSKILRGLSGVFIKTYTFIKLVKISIPSIFFIPDILRLFYALRSFLLMLLSTFVFIFMTSVDLFMTSADLLQTSTLSLLINIRV